MPSTVEYNSSNVTVHAPEPSYSMQEQHTAAAEPGVTALEQTMHVPENPAI